MLVRKRIEKHPCLLIVIETRRLVYKLYPQLGRDNIRLIGNRYSSERRVDRAQSRELSRKGKRSKPLQAQIQRSFFLSFLQSSITAPLHDPGRFNTDIIMFSQEDHWSRHTGRGDQSKLMPNSARRSRFFARGGLLVPPEFSQDADEEIRRSVLHARAFDYVLPVGRWAAFSVPVRDRFACSDTKHETEITGGIRIRADRVATTGAGSSAWELPQVNAPDNARPEAKGSMPIRDLH